MHNIAHISETLRRPRLLVRAARMGAEGYRRDTDLPRLLGSLPAGLEAALDRLIEIEADLDQARRGARAGYPPARHVAVLARRAWAAAAAPW
ncbi:DUF6477 family protein [Roseivivax sp. CAU 1761]